MSYELPNIAVDALNFIGLPWPAVDEDELHGWAKDVRAFSTEIIEISKLSHASVQELRHGSSSSFVTKLADSWDRYHSQILAVQPVMDVFADALDAAADAVLAQKIVVSGQVVALATEIGLTQGEALVTFGIAEAEVPLEVAITKKAVRFALSELENKVIGYLIDQAATHLSHHIGTTATQMLLSGVDTYSEVQSLKADYDALAKLGGIARTYRDRTENSSIAARRKAASRRVETHEAGGRWHVVEVLLAALRSIAEDMFAKLPGVLHTVLADLEKDVKKYEAELRKADASLTAHAPHPDTDSPPAPALAGGTAAAGGAGAAGAGAKPSSGRGGETRGGRGRRAERRGRTPRLPCGRQREHHPAQPGPHQVTAHR